MAERVLITGAEGFTGRYLAVELSAAGYEVCGLVRRMPDETIVGVKAMYISDLSDTAGLARIVAEVQPDRVVHLAAITFVAHDKVEEIYCTNLMGTRNLLEALKLASKPLQAVLLASSANVYGNTITGILDETTHCQPANDYAVSKLAMEYMAKLYTDYLPIIITRPFNYTGAGQAENFLLPKIVNHVLRHASVIELGNLDVARDFSDVRTVVQYYRRLIECPAAIGETFNVCSGRAYTVHEVLNIITTLSGHDCEVQVNPALFRKNEVKMLLGNCAKLRSVVGDIPVISLPETLHWMLKLNS